MLRSKISERVQEVILPDFPDDENTVPTVTKSRRVSFGTNFVKEFIVGSTVSGQCLTEYEQAFPSSDSSTADSSHSVVEGGVLDQSSFAPPPDLHKNQKPPVGQSFEMDFTESRSKLPKFSSTVCFSSDSPTADMEFTEGCITLAKTILDKKNKEMTVIIQAKPKEPKDQDKPKDEKTHIFSKFENEMSITRCNRVFDKDNSDDSWEECKENRMPLDMIMRHLDKDNSDLENDLFNPEKTFANIFNANPLDLTNESEKLNLNESMDISGDFPVMGPQNFSHNAMTSEILIRKSLQLRTSYQIDQGSTKATEKSFVGVPVDDEIDKSGEEMSLDEGHPFERAQPPPDTEMSLDEGHPFEKAQPPDADSTDYKMNRSALYVPDEVLTPAIEQSLTLPVIGDDKINISSQHLSLGVLLPVKELSVMEPTDTDHKVSESTERSESEEVVTCDKEPSLLDLRPMDKKNESEERRRCLDLSSNECQLNKSTGRMSFNGSIGVLFPEKQVSEPVVEPAVDETRKSPERMSLDGSEEVVPSEIVESLAERLGDDQVNTSSQEKSLEGTEDILTCEKEQSLMELTSGDRMGESTEPKVMELTSCDKICESTEPKVMELTSCDKICESTEPKVMELTSGGRKSLSAGPKMMELTSCDKVSESTEPKIMELTSGGRISLSAGPKMMEVTSCDKISDSTEPKIMGLTSGGRKSLSAGSKMMEVTSCNKISDSTEPKIMELTSGGRKSLSAGPKMMVVTSCNKIGESTELKVMDLTSTDRSSDSGEVGMVVDLHSTDKISESEKEGMLVASIDNINETKEGMVASVDNINETEEQMVLDPPPTGTTEQVSVETGEVLATETPKEKSTEEQSLDETEEMSTSEIEPALVDIKVIESLEEQSKEPGCVWSLTKPVLFPQKKAQGLLSVNCKLLDSSTSIHFRLKMTNEDSLVACSMVTESEISLNEEKQLHLPEYRLLVDFGFDELKKYFDERRRKVETIRHVPYFLDEVNSFVGKMNSCLRQILSILTSYPGSRLEGSRLSFRLFSFPIFFSCTVSIDLSNSFRFSKSSLSFEIDFGSLDENKLREIFQDCLKRGNSLIEFVVQSTKYLVDVERKSGYVSKRGHIRLLPAELKL